MKHNYTRTITLAVLVISTSGLAAVAGPTKKATPNDKNLLRGPKVVDTSSTSQRSRKDSMRNKSTTAHPMKGVDKQQGRPLNFRDYLSAMRQIEGRRDENTLNLTQAQRDQLRMIVQEQREAMRAFQEEHQDQIQRMREAAKSGAQPANKKAQRKHNAIESAKDREKNTKGDRAGNARQKLRKFIDNAPPSINALAKIERVLTPEQLSTIRTHIRTVRERRANDAQRPGQARRQRGAREHNNSETARPQSGKRINPNRVRNKGPRDAQHNKRAKPSKGNKPNRTKKHDKP